MKTVIVLGNINNIDVSDLANSYLIGVEMGAKHLIDLGYIPDLSIGDFDSTSEADLNIIRQKSKNIIILNPIKDKTDTEEAILKSLDKNDILILGGIKGSRIEHFYANLLLIKKYPNIIMKDDNSKIYIKNQSFMTTNEYKYISLFPIDDYAIISILGMKYNLSNYKLEKDIPTLGISNESSKNGYVEIKEGSLLVIESKDNENI